MQGKEIINQLGNVARVSVPMLVYFLAMFAPSLVIAWYSRMTYAYAATQAFTASSNKWVDGGGRAGWGGGGVWKRVHEVRAAKRIRAGLNTLKAGRRR